MKNGSLGIVEDIRRGIVQVRLEGSDGRIAVDTHFYRDLAYGYATTVHKSQGSTVDHAYILATGHYDRHTAYVALSRHREAATVFYAAEDFGPRSEEPVTSAEARKRFLDILSRARPKELAHDYLEQEPLGPVSPRSFGTLDAAQQGAADRWRERYPEAGPERDAAERYDFERSLSRLQELSARSFDASAEHPTPGPELDLDL